MATALKDGRTLAKAAHAELKRDHSDWSVDELLLHPTAALQVCRTVRKKLGKQIPDEDVLRALLNGRKRGFLKDGK